jgi:hypothetical protein
MLLIFSVNPVKFNKVYQQEFNIDSFYVTEGVPFGIRRKLLYYLRPKIDRSQILCLDSVNF